MGLVKRDYTDQETLITAKNLNEIQDAILDLEDGLFSVDNDKSGEVISITDAAHRGFRRFSIFGKTTQDGTPTPDAPVDLVSAGDNGAINTTVCGKNLVNAITNGSQTYGYAVALSCEVDALAPNTEYAVSFVGAAGHKIYANEKLFAYKEFVCDGNRQTVVLKTQKGISKTREDQYSASEKWIVFKNLDGNTVVPNFKDVQIECDTTPTAYEPYKEQAMTIATPNGLPGIPVASGGNYTDTNGQQWICDEIDLTRGVHVQRVGKSVLDGSVPFAWSSSGAFVLLKADALQIDRANQSTMSGVLCDAYPAKTWAVITALAQDGASLAWSNGLAIHDNNFATVDEFNAHLATNPITMYYLLATPIETPLSEEELAAYASLHTYKNHTTVSNDAGAYMELEYVMDAKKYIDGLMTGTIIPATVE